MNIHPTTFSISQNDREKWNNHRSIVIWFTGLSGSGKSSIAYECEQLFFNKKIHCFPLDGDNIRTSLNADLGFSLEDRGENIRRIAELAKLLMQSGQVVLASFISPLEKDRLLAKKIVGEENFFEVYIDTPLEICQKRDPKGLYKKVEIGEISNFTGIDSPYEPPSQPNLIISTKGKTAQECAIELINQLMPLIQLKN